MSQSLYELVALGARYVFAALMLLIVLRAWRITIIDSRRAASLRRMSPQTGLSGELVVTEGDEKARRGMRYPVIREGMIGSSHRADIRIRHSSIRRRHAYFQLTEAGLTVRTHAGAPMADAMGRPAKSLTLPDGGAFSLGRVDLLLVLSEAPAPARRPPEPREARDDPYDRIERPARHGRTHRPAHGNAANPDDLFREHPLLQHETYDPRDDEQDFFHVGNE